jgi:hypothetical protein
MILIAHRGNTNGPMESWENEPTYIDLAISKGYDVEIDVWYKDGVLWLGHDKPQYGGDFKWFIDRKTKLWVHCKNIEAINYFKNTQYDFNYFWHETDTVTLTSLKYIWAYPNKQPIENSIAVMPEIHDDDISKCIGICSDYIEKYK